MLDGIDLWTIRRLKDQPNILWHLQVLRSMPAGLIDLHDHEVVGKVVSYLSQKEIQHFGIGVWQNQRGHQALLGCHRCKDIAELANDLPRGFRPDTWWCPSSFGPISTPKASLILGHG